MRGPRELAPGVHGLGSELVNWYLVEDGGRIYWIYNYKRGAFYPFVPAPGTQARDSERELRLRAQVGAELPIEEELGRWFPLWDIPI